MKKQNMLQDAELMEGFRSGNERCLAEVFNKLYPALCFYAFKIVNDRSVAEEITDESFIKTWEKRTGFYQFNVLRSYLFTTIRNSCINWLKMDKRRKTAEKEILLAGLESDRSRLESMIRAEFYAQINDALEDLPAQNKKIMKLIFVEGKNIREASAELGLSVSTIKTQKSRGIAHLKERLFNLFFEY